MAPKHRSLGRGDKRTVRVEETSELSGSRMHTRKYAPDTMEEVCVDHENKRWRSIDKVLKCFVSRPTRRLAWRRFGRHRIKISVRCT